MRLILKNFDSFLRNEAAILAARKDKDIIERAEIMEAIRRVEFLFAVLEF